MDNKSNPLVDAANAIQASGSIDKKPLIRSLESVERRLNPAIENKDYRESHSADKPKCNVKIVINSRVYGIKGTGGSRLAKSAIRLAIDTGVQTPSTFVRNSVKSFPRIKTLVVKQMSSEEAVEYLNDFEHKYGGKATEQFLKLRDLYKTTKTRELTELGIKTDSSGRPLYKDEASQAAYFNEMKSLSFPYYEVYLSVQPEGGRATRSQALRVKDLDELEKLFPKVKFEIQ